jgi:outer membrane protein
MRNCKFKTVHLVFALMLYGIAQPNGGFADEQNPADSNAEAELASVIDLQRRNRIIKEELNRLDQEITKLYAETRSSAEDKPADNGWKLTLKDVTGRVLEQNIDIKVEFLDMDTSSRSVTKEDADFDPSVTLSTSLTRTRTPSATLGTSTIGETVRHDAAVSQRMFSGGTVTLALDHDRTGRSERTYASDVRVVVAQPLLRDMGPRVTYADLNISRVNFDIAYLDLKNQIINAITSSQLAYWDILEASEVLIARELAFTQAVDLVVQSKKEMALGKRTYTDVLKSEASAASREVNVLEAKDSLFDNEDNLKQILSVRDPDLWKRRILISDTIDPEFKPISIELEDAIKQAFLHRPDYLSALQVLERNKISFMLSKNDLLPDFDLNFNYDLDSAGDTGFSFNRVFTGNYPNWGSTLSLTIPWGYRSQIADYNQKLNDMKRQELVVRDLELQIIKEVRSDFRQVKTNVQRVTSAELAFTLESKKLEAEQRKFELGISSSFEVLEFQEDLVNASVTRISTITDYHQSVISLWQTLGTTLEQNNIKFEERTMTKA